MNKISNSRNGREIPDNPTRYRQEFDGFCRAAVYSYEAVQKVKAGPARLEFAVLRIVGPLPRTTVERLTQWLGARPGVDSGTAKISITQKSMGFVWEKFVSKEALIADLRKVFPELEVHALTYENPAYAPLQ